MLPTLTAASVLLALSLSPLATPETVHAPEDPPATAPYVMTTQEVADRYFKLTFDAPRTGDWADTISPLFAEDATFVDPATAVFGMPLSQGIHGREAIVREMLAFGLIDHSLNVEAAFVAGEYAVFYGQFTNSARTSTDLAIEPIPTTYPLVSILRVVQGEIVERRDYGDYWSLMRQLATAQTLGATDSDAAAETPAMPFDEAAKALLENGVAYRKAYAACNWKALGEFWADEVTFQDPTGELFGVGQLAVGENEVRTFLQAALETIAANGGLHLTPKAAFCTGPFAISLQHITWPAKARELGIETEDPDELVQLGADVVIVLEFKDGHVINHRDYAAYESLTVTR